MKFFSAIIVLFSLVSTKASAWSFCGGVNVDQAIEIMDGITCGMAILSASVYKEGTQECSNIQAGESLCCPKAVLSDQTGGSCSFCRSTQNFLLGWLVQTLQHWLNMCLVPLKSVFTRWILQWDNEVVTTLLACFRKMMMLLAATAITATIPLRFQFHVFLPYPHAKVNATTILAIPLQYFGTCNCLLFVLVTQFLHKDLRPATAINYLQHAELSCQEKLADVCIRICAKSFGQLKVTRFALLSA